METEAKRAFCYCRVSSEEQSTEDHYSLGNQEKRAKDFAKSKNWSLLKIRKDVASGKDTNRPGYKEMVAQIKAKQVDVVIVYRLDRLSRNVRDVYDMLDLMKKHEVDFVSLTEGFDTTTAMGRAMLGVAAVFAQLTREMIAENVKDGLLRRAEAGKWNGPKWNPPYGYRYVAGESIEPIEEQVKVVQQIFNWFIQDRWGTMKIARYLNNQGIWRENYQGQAQWHQSKVWEMLDNPVYAGYIKAGDKLVKGIHQPLIDEETWEQAKARMESQRKKPAASKGSPHLLSGLVRCGKCDRALVAQKAKYQNKQGEQSYYGFRHSPNELAGERHCPGVYHRGDTLEEAVIEAFHELARDPMLADNIARHTSSLADKDNSPLISAEVQLQQDLTKLDERFETWADRLDRGLIDEAQFENRNRTLRQERRQVVEKLEDVQKQLSGQPKAQLSIVDIQTALKDAERLWTSMTFEQRREVLQLLIQKIAIHPDKVELIIYNLPPKELHTKRAGVDYVKRSENYQKLKQVSDTSNS